MGDLHSRFRRLDRVRVPDVWAEATLRAETASRSMPAARVVDQRPVRLRFVIVGVLMAVAVITMAALVVSGVIRPLPNVTPPGPATPTAQPVVSMAPTPRAAASPGIGDGPALTWEEVPLASGTLADSLVYAGDRFVEYSGGFTGSAVGTSVDGIDWQPADGTIIPNPSDGTTWGASPAISAWGGTILGWGSGVPSGLGILHIWRTDGSESSHDFGGAIYDAAIGPRGIVVLGVGLGNGAAWYSVDGAAWFRVTVAPHQLNMAEPPFGPQVAATPDGFIAEYPDGSVWLSSPDGLTWRVIGTDSLGSYDLLPWRAGVLSVNYSARRYVYWTADGGEEVPMAAGLADLPAAPPPYPPATAAGPLGIVTVDRDANLMLFSPDGRAWRATALPASRSWSAESASWFATSVAVGPDSVLVMLWERAPTGGDDVPSLWRGTLK